jgi:succinate-semialdehyde dehydrogenase/glutarate-semialdehyde dehydrogenase
VAGPPDDSLTLAEESFGPLAAVQRVPDDLDALLAVANAGRFGLSGAVFGTSLDETIAVASRLQVGQVTINDTSNYWELHMPFGGAAGRDSGIGRLGGRYVAEHFTQAQSISITLKANWRS